MACHVHMAFARKDTFIDDRYTSFGREYTFSVQYPRADMAGHVPTTLLWSVNDMQSQIKDKKVG